MAKSMRQRLEAAEDLHLAPYALRSSSATRRHRIEDEGRVFDYRSAFQRDRDRIVYSRAFRRLRQKAQTGILPEYADHRRNRLTHTLEVSQFARTIGRALALNEDLIEAVALAHDLGQPPFGPAGERALDDLMSGRMDGRGGPGLGDLGGFWHSWQGLRIVDRIEKRYERDGLNLSDSVREGILKCGSDPRCAPDELVGVRVGLPGGFEVQVVQLADRIVTALSDLDDALQAGALEIPRVEKLAIVRQLRKKLGDHYRPRASRFMKINAIHRGLTHLLVTGAIIASERALARWAERHRVKTYRSFLPTRERIVGDEISLPPAGCKMLAEIEGLLETGVRRRFEAERIDGRGRRVLLGLFAAYQADPALLDDHVLIRYRQSTGCRYLRDLPRDAVEGEVVKRYRPDPRFSRLLADHLSAMTDSYALLEQARLTEVGAVPIPSAEQIRRESRRSAPARVRSQRPRARP